MTTSPYGVMYPRMRLDLAALEHNITVMAAWCDNHGVELAPHVKTTMSAPIAERQMAAGAAGLTVATVEQSEVVSSWGHRRILIANEIVDVSALMRLRTLLESDDNTEIACFVDRCTDRRRCLRRRRPPPCRPA